MRLCTLSNQFDYKENKKLKPGALIKETSFIVPLSLIYNVITNVFVKSTAWVAMGQPKYPSIER